LLARYAKKKSKSGHRLCSLARGYAARSLEKPRYARLEKELAGRSSAFLKRRKRRNKKIFTNVKCFFLCGIVTFRYQKVIKNAFVCRCFLIG
jgi:hypothetical protein